MTYQPANLPMVAPDNARFIMDTLATLASTARDHYRAIAYENLSVCYGTHSDNKVRAEIWEVMFDVNSDSEFTDENLAMVLTSCAAWTLIAARNYKAWAKV